MTNIYIVSLEPIDTRYTGQWHAGLKNILKKEIQGRNLKNYSIFQIDGIIRDQVSANTPTEGAFLNFIQTNRWKSEQLIAISDLFDKKMINPGDKFLFTDAWNPSIISLKYMSELLEIPVEIHSMWHAGSYDPQDFLGRLIKDKRWTFSAEKAFFHASNFNYFATNFHIELFATNLFGKNEWYHEAYNEKAIRSGQPHDLLIEQLSHYTNLPKEDIILFPHRVAPEKQVEIFKDLEQALPEYKWVVCQEQKLSKHQYHTMLGKSKLVFSANLQETLGISTCIEAPLVTSLPLAPRRLSDSEIF